MEMHPQPAEQNFTGEEDRIQRDMRIYLVATLNFYSVGG